MSEPESGLILVTGAVGGVGGKVVTLLRQRDRAVRGFAHHDDWPGSIAKTGMTA